MNKTTTTTTTSKTKLLIITRYVSKINAYGYGTTSQIII